MINKMNNKAVEIEKMFDSISKEYDFLNRIITFGTDAKNKKEITHRPLTLTMLKRFVCDMYALSRTWQYIIYDTFRVHALQQRNAH